jgi:hypothetical protein
LLGFNWLSGKIPFPNPKSIDLSLCTGWVILIVVNIAIAIVPITIIIDINMILLIRLENLLLVFIC